MTPEPLKRIKKCFDVPLTAHKGCGKKTFHYGFKFITSTGSNGIMYLCTICMKKEINKAFEDAI